LSSCLAKASVVCEDGGSAPRRLVVLGMGGTIAGRAASADDNVGYRAGEVGVGELLGALPVLPGFALEAEQVCQIDSKDMGPVHWQALAGALDRHLARPEVAAVVVTHGTDTLEETAYLLHRLVGAAKPVVLTAAMRPATALSADGPRNLADALVVAAEAARLDWHGVVAVMGGQVWAGAELRKWHSYRVDAFDAGDAGPLALVQEGRVLPLRAWPAGGALGTALVREPVASWPQVDIVTSHAGANGRLVKLLMTAGVDGLVVAGTGNGTLHADLEAALVKAERAGIRVLRSTRSLSGGVVEPSDGAGTARIDGAAPPADARAVATRRLPSAGSLTPAQARVELLLDLLGQRSRPRGRTG
jgi:L-asparaginase